jgi:hypothetical protein
MPPASTEQHTRHERELIERRTVAAQRSIGLGAARDIAEDRARQQAAGFILEIFE